MRVLGLDCSGLMCSVALWEDHIIKGQYSIHLKKQHSALLLPLLQEIKEKIDLDFETLDGIAITNGPGSFTGIRIGVVSVKGLAMGLEIPTIPVSTLEALAYGMWNGSGLICPILDARRQQVYTGVYSFEQGKFICCKEEEAMKLEDLLSWLKEQKKPVTFLGDGVEVYKPVIEEQSQFEHYYAPAHINRQQAAVVAALGAKYLEEGKTLLAEQLVPNYLRLPQAQRERQKALQQEKERVE